MRDRTWIAVGMAIFVVALTSPFWYAQVGVKASIKGPELVLRTNEKECVAPAGTMRAEHMRMLMNWREDVVRRSNRQYVAFNGKVYEKSLTHTCLGCHNKAEFCDRCHAYSGVATPNCWNCHNEPQTAVARSTP